MKQHTISCKCGHVSSGPYPNLCGKICPKCESFIPPTSRLRLVEENEIKKKLITKQVRASIRRKFGLPGDE